MCRLLIFLGVSVTLTLQAAARQEHGSAETVSHINANLNKEDQSVPLWVHP